MEKKTNQKRRNKRRQKKLTAIGILCWIALPFAVVTLLVLDGIGVYRFNTERLLVMGVCVLVALIPFFEEITIKNISVKKKHDPHNKQDRV